MQIICTRSKLSSTIPTTPDYLNSVHPAWFIQMVHIIMRCIVIPIYRHYTSCKARSVVSTAVQ